MPNPLNHWTAKSAQYLAISLAVALAAPGTASAQATVAAQRGAAITPFVQTTLVRPDWGQTDNIGFSAGVDYTRFFHSIIQPSLELRMTDAGGLNVAERSFTGGFKLETTILGIHPYGTLLAGTGVITFMHPQPGYGSDTSFVYSLGGGAEFNVMRGWKLRADFAQQHWDLDPQLLTPMNFSLGVAYNIPFHNGGWEH
jgi:hypothetical protein